MRLVSAALAALLAAGCTRVAPDEKADDLAGFRGRLLPGPSMRLAVQGSVGEREAEVWFDLASPLSTVTTGCYSSAPSSGGVIRSPTAEGPPRELPEVKLRRARVGNLRLGTRDVGLVRDQRCAVSLGSDVLLPYAIQADPARRELALTPSLPRERYTALLSSAEAQRSGDELHLLELSRHPDGDWPMLAVQLSQGRAQLTGPFVLSTREANTMASAAALQRAGFQPGLPELPASSPPPELAAYGLDGLELSPGFGLRRATLWTDGRWKNPSVLGALGANVWGRFHSTFDLRAGVLVLRRPRVLAAGSRQQCALAGPGGLSEEACFGLHSQPAEGGLDAVGTVWRDLPEGGRLYLEPVGADGATLRAECRIGFTFTSADRGASAQHHFPWPGLEQSMPGCAAMLRGARGVKLALFEEGGSADCPGQCAFATALVSGRSSCECAPHLGGGSDDEQRFLELYRKLLEQHRVPRPPAPAAEPEPE